VAWLSTAFAIVNSDAKVAGVALAALLTAGVAVQPVRELVHQAKAGLQPSAASCEPAPITRQQMSAVMLGGLRALVADGLWLKTYLAWAACDLPATERLLRLVTIVDDRPVYFWLNGARIMAYDMTQWRLAAHARGGGAAEGERRIVEEQASAALRYLAEARRRHPESAAVCVETANIHLYRRGDVASAAEWYRRAAGSPDAPFYAARVYGELLRRIGRKREAYDWLCRLHPTLPADDREAMREVVMSRIRDLERELSLSSNEQYTPRSNSEMRRNR
jgi:TPR repeat protein